LDGSCSSTYSTTFYKGYFDKWHKIKVQVFEAKRQEEEIRAIVLEMGGYLSTYSRTRPYQLVSIIDYKFKLILFLELELTSSIVFLVSWLH
jgi:hypothetical protein